MGLIRDAIGSALGANQINNGFNGPRLPFTSNDNNNNNNNNGIGSGGRGLSPRHRRDLSYGDSLYPGNRRYHRSSDCVGPPSFAQDYESYRSSGLPRPRSSRGEFNSGFERQAGPFDGRGIDPNEHRPPQLSPEHQPPSIPRRTPSLHDVKRRYTDSCPSPSPSPPPYSEHEPVHDTNVRQETANSGYIDRHRRQSSRRDAPQSQPYINSSQGRNTGLEQDCGFRPFALPQVAYGDGKPFLRGYSDELVRYGVLEEDFIRVVDAINVAIIPNPENQIFQKGANIAGWFIPGAASIGVMAGQIGVGVGAAFGHASMVARSLSKANLDLFVPNGLEICIGKSKDVDAEVGVSPPYAQQQRRYSDTSPEGRLAAYGDLLAPLSNVLPALQVTGRTDPLAMLGRGLGEHDMNRKIRRAEKNMAKGKGKGFNALEGGVKWLIVRPASPNALSQWRKTLHESEAALEQEQEQANVTAQTRPGRW